MEIYFQKITRGLFMSKNLYQQMNILKIFFKGLLIYIKNFIPLSRVMIFPVFGQIVGIIWILLAAYIFARNISTLLPADIISSILLVFLILIVITLPGFALMVKAFWEYTIVMVSLNSMIANIIRQNHIKDTEIHTQTIKLRSREYISLLTLLILIWVLGLIPASALMIFPVISSYFGISLPVLIPLGLIGLGIAALLAYFVVLNYVSLCFQVFAFENISPYNVLKRSWQLVEGNFWRIVFLGLILSVVTTNLIPGIVQALIDNTPVISFITVPFQSYITILAGSPDIHISLPFITGADSSISGISRIVALWSLGGIITMFLLPLGSACYTLLYFDVISRKNKKK